MKLSIITVCYNEESRIEDTIRSVLSQKTRDEEYIIIDGKSDDGTMNIIDRYIDNIDILISEKDRGIYDAFNKGINLATGKAVIFVNAGDEIASNAIVNIRKEYSDVYDVIYGNTIVVESKFGKRVLKKPLNLDKIKYSLPFCNQSCCFSTYAFIKYGSYNIEYKLCADYDLIRKMYLFGAKFHYIDQPISIFSKGGVSEDPIATMHECLKIATNSGTKRSEYILYAMNRYLYAFIINTLRITHTYWLVVKAQNYLSSNTK